jgi:hypothetical protein
MNHLKDFKDITDANIWFRQNPDVVVVGISNYNAFGSTFRILVAYTTKE